MSRRKLPPLGSVFLVPLRDEGHALGVLARASGEGHAFGYFYGSRVSAAGDGFHDELDPERAVLVGKFGDLELLRGNWPVIGAVADWSPSRWPMRPLARIDQDNGRAWLVTYDDGFNCVDEREVDTETASRYHYDRMMGAGAVEIRLTKLVKEDEQGS